MKVGSFSVLYFMMLVITSNAVAQTSMGNVFGRNTTSLNGKWQAIIDPYDVGSGDWKALYKDRKPSGKTDFFEYSFDNGPILDVPGDFNSQLPELTFYESTVWYKKTFPYQKKPGKRLFLHFGAINYRADVYFNNTKIASHEGGFTPFQIELTQAVQEGENSVIVRVNNRRLKDGIPSVGYDWLNYGGIARDVNLIETPTVFIQDYFIQLQKGFNNRIKGWVQLDGNPLAQAITVRIPEADIRQKTRSNSEGRALLDFTAKLQLWSPENPKLYEVIIESETDTIREWIGFRNIEVKGTEILLNGKSIFLKGVNTHEEIPQRRGRAYSETDALMLLNWAKELGCNFVRLAHYPHNEYLVRLADRLGLMVWSEIPVYQGIEFTNPEVPKKMDEMLREMIQRDRNRCSIVIWSVSNETWSSTPGRNEAITRMHQFCRSLDSTRLISSAVAGAKYEGNIASIEDEIFANADVLAVNEYFGWYNTFPDKPENMIWKSKFNKPLIMTEFGGEALYGQSENPDRASSWSEGYQENIYKEQVKMFQNIPFLRGTSAWILADFRSPVRMHPIYQDGWNRKGLLSDKGLKKKAWYILKKFYENK